MVFRLVVLVVELSETSNLGVLVLRIAQAATEYSPSLLFLSLFSLVTNRDMDMIMTELAAALPLDIMPGPDDPANVSLPQQPLHQCLFPGGWDRRISLVPRRMGALVQ